MKSTEGGPVEAGKAGAHEKLVREYLSGLEAGDAERILSLFTGDGIVCSPLYGERPAARFFPGLFEDTRNSRITLKGVFEGTSRSPRVAAWFIYDWTLRDGSPVRFECMDVFELDERSGRIRRLTILYDSARTRGALDESRRSSGA